MYIDFSQLTPSEAYFNMIQTVIPRPIAWVLSENNDAGYNLAPFSYFNAVSSNPPLLFISIGHKDDGVAKDTLVNIRERPRFVVHIAHLEQAEAMNATSASLPYGESELDHTDLSLTRFDGFGLPRIAQCRVALACELYEIKELGPNPQYLVFGRVRHLYVDDAVVSVSEKGRVKIHADRINPIGRLGGGEYVSFGDIIRLQRPC